MLFNPDDKPRERLLKVASSRFFEKGFATGIDEIITEANVARMSLYNLFRNRSGLEAGVLKMAQDQRLEPLSRVATDKNSIIEAVMELCRVTASMDARGGLVSQALLHYPDPQNPTHQLAQSLQSELLQKLTSCCENTACPSPNQVAKRLLLVVVGYSVLVKVLPNQEVLETSLSSITQILSGNVETRHGEASERSQPNQGEHTRVVRSPTEDDDLTESEIIAAQDKEFPIRIIRAEF